MTENLGGRLRLYKSANYIVSRWLDKKRNTHPSASAARRFSSAVVLARSKRGSMANSILPFPRLPWLRVSLLCPPAQWVPCWRLSMTKNTVPTTCGAHGRHADMGQCTWHNMSSSSAEIDE
jgi:hypothetical protein